MVHRICSPALLSRRALCAFSFLALIVLPLAVRAQDVIVLPPPATTAMATTATAAPAVATPAPAPVPAPVESAPRVVTQRSVPLMLPLATATAQPVVTTAALDPQFRQCATDADCVLATDGCGALEAVGKPYVQNWQAAMPRGDDCRPAFDLAKVQLSLRAVCHDALCGLQPRNGK